jgi:hypothetical protein
MIKYDNIDLLVEEVGETENKEALVLEGEDIIDAYNSGNEGVLVRFSTVDTSTLIVEGEEIAFKFSDEILKDFPTWVDSKVGKVRMLVDKFTGKVYSQVKQEEDTQLFYHSNMKVESEIFETRKEGEDEVVFKTAAPLWKKLEKGNWVVDEDMIELTNTSLAISLTNYMGE